MITTQIWYNYAIYKTKRKLKLKLKLKLNVRSKETRCINYNINQQNQQSSLCNLLIKYNFNFF